jgi:hypothetical protein
VEQEETPLAGGNFAAVVRVGVYPLPAVMWSDAALTGAARRLYDATLYGNAGASEHGRGQRHADRRVGGGDAGWVRGWLAEAAASRL